MRWIAEHLSLMETEDLRLLAKQVEFSGAADLDDEELKSRLYCLVVPEGSSETAAIQGICHNLLVPTTGDPSVDLDRARWQLWREVSNLLEHSGDGQPPSLPKLMRALSPTFKARMDDLARERQRVNAHAVIRGAERPELLPFVAAIKGFSVIYNTYQRRRLAKTYVIPLIVFHAVATKAALEGDVPPAAFGEREQILLDLKMRVGRTNTHGQWFFPDDIPDQCRDAVRTGSGRSRPADEECLIAIDHWSRDPDDFAGIIVTNHAVFWTEDNGVNECKLDRAVLSRHEPESWWKEPELRMGCEQLPYLAYLDPGLMDMLNDTFARLAALRS